MSAGRIVVTGAAGFLGAEVVRAARAAGLAVTAILRRAVPVPEGVDLLVLDLADPAAQPALVQALSGARAVIHAAARLSGDASAHARDTGAATEALAQAVRQAAAPPRILLAGSIAVYDFAALPAGAVLDETAPLSDGVGRDAYARAKRAQEVTLAALSPAVEVGLLRIGLLYGPGRMWNAHLGFGLGPLVLCPGGRLPLPAIHVVDAAAALVAAALAPAALFAPGPLVLNLLAEDLPRQSDWLAALGRPLVLRLPLVPLAALVRLCDGVSRVIPGLGARLPGLLHGPTFAARFKPFAWDATRAVRTLGLETRHFAPVQEPPHG